MVKVSEIANKKTQKGISHNLSDNTFILSDFSFKLEDTETNITENPMNLPIFKVHVHKEDDGLWVEVPSLPGCYSQGNNIEELENNIFEAINAYLEVIKEEGRDKKIIYEKDKFVVEFVWC